MNRKYTREIYLDRIARLKEACPDIALSTDIIVGFPSETQEDFEQTLSLLEAVEYDSIFAFAYSDRSSAPASKFPDQVDEEEKMRRLNLLLKRQEEITEAKHKAKIGRVVEVLVVGESAKLREGFDKTHANMKQMSGRSESNTIVHFPSDTAQIGDLLKIRIENAYPHSLWGVPLGVDE